MSTIKISQLPLVTTFTANTQNTVFVGVDLDAGLTGQFTAQAIARNLYLNNTLIVGNNVVQFDNVIGQFSGSSPTYLQINNQNFNANGSADYVASTSDSDNTFGFVDMGIEGPTYDGVAAGYPAFKPYDGYLYMVGKTTTSPTGNLVIGTQNKANTVFINGGVTNQDIVALMTANGLVLNTQSYITFADGTRQITNAASFNYTTTASAVANNASANSILLQAGLNATNTNVAIALAGVAAANANISSGVAAVNANIAFLNAVNLTQNDNITTATTLSQYALGVQTTQNTRIQTAQNQANVAGIVANTTAVVANSALQNTATIITAGNLRVTGNTVTQAMNTTNFQVVGTANVSGTLGVYGVITGSAQVVLQNTQFSATESALTISASPTTALPSNDGYMIHISGKNGIPSRIVTDSYGTGAYAVYTGRAARGTIDSPTALQAGDIISRFAGNGYGTTKYQSLGVGRIDFIAAENFTDANTGSRIQFWNCSVGSNTLTNIATFNGDSVEFTGSVKPDKGFIYTPRTLSGAQTAITINFSSDSIVRATLTADLTLSFSNYTAGKIVEVWLTNTGGTTRTITHGCSATNSSDNSTTFDIPSTSSAYLRYFSLDGDLANTFVTSVHA
jgi:hypothetical protein